MFATLQNQKMLHGKKGKKCILSVMHRTSDVPKVPKSCNRVWNQDWIAPAYYLNHEILVLNLKYTLGKRCRIKGTQEHSAPNLTLSFW